MNPFVSFVVELMIKILLVYVGIVLIVVGAAFWTMTTTRPTRRRSDDPPNHLKLW